MLGKRIAIPVFGLLFGTYLSACSGGDTSAPSTTALSVNSAEGRWVGTMQNSSPNATRTISSLVLDDGVYWILYSVAGKPSILEGFIRGTSDSQNGTLTSSDGKDFNLQTGSLNATINGSYATKQSLNGTIVYQNSTQNTFTMTYDRDYDLTPDMNTVAGTYNGFVTANETATIDLSFAGTLPGKILGSSSTGCLFTGTFSPRSHGNVFDVAITFGVQSGCTIGPETVNGVGFYDVQTRQLTSAAFNIAKTDGFVFIGTKQ